MSTRPCRRPSRTRREVFRFVQTSAASTSIRPSSRGFAGPVHAARCFRRSDGPPVAEGEGVVVVVAVDDVDVDAEELVEALGVGDEQRLHARSRLERQPRAGADELGDDLALQLLVVDDGNVARDEAAVAPRLAVLARLQDLLAVLDAVAVGVAGEEGCDVRRLGAQLRERPGRRVAPRRRHHGAGPRAARGNALSFPAVSAARGSCPAPCSAVRQARRLWSCGGGGASASLRRRSSSPPVVRAPRVAARPPARQLHRAAPRPRPSPCFRCPVTRG